MKRSFLSWISGIRSLWRKSPPNPSSVLRARLWVEELERRTVPASLLWIGPSFGLFSNMNNWADFGTGQVAAAAPKNGDTLTFDPTQKAGNLQGSNQTADDDILGLTLSQLIIGANYTYTGGNTGSVQIGTPLTVATLTQSGGDISGAATGRLDLTGGNSTWTGGTMSDIGNTVVDAGATLNISGTVGLNGRTFLVDAGGIVNATTGTLSMANRATISDSGTWNDNTDATIIYGGGDMGYFSVIDAGIFNKKTGQQGEDTRVEVPFNNSSTNANAVQVNQGTLLLAGGGTSRGIYQVAANSTLDFGGWLGVPSGTDTWNTGTNLRGAGTVAIDAIVNIPANNTANAINVLLDGGIVQGGGTLVISGNLNWQYGTMQAGSDGAGQTTLAKGATATIGGNAIQDRQMQVPILDGRVFENDGQVRESGPTQGDDPGPITFQVNDGATLKNVGSFIFMDDSGMGQVTGTTRSRLDNPGTVFKAAGNGLSVIGLDIGPNFGSIRSSPTIRGSIRSTGSNMTMSSGTFEVGGVEFTSNFTQTGGTVLLDSGLFTVDGTYQQTGGSIDFSSGSLTVGGGLQVGAGAEIVGAGVITADVTNAGLIDMISSGVPGVITIASNSQLGIGGNYTQTSSGTLNLAVFGPGAFDQLAIAGSATLAGTLNVAWLGGSTPPPLSGPDYPLLTYASRLNNSQFGTVNLPSFSDRHFDPRYDDPNAPDAFSLWVVSN